jgi:hypothetical protein
VIGKVFSTAFFVTQKNVKGSVIAHNLLLVCFAFNPIAMERLSGVFWLKRVLPTKDMIWVCQGLMWYL